MAGLRPVEIEAERGRLVCLNRYLRSHSRQWICERKKKKTLLSQKASRIQYFIFEGWGNEISVSSWTLQKISLSDPQTVGNCVCP